MSSPPPRTDNAVQAGLHLWIERDCEGIDVRADVGVAVIGTRISIDHGGVEGREVVNGVLEGLGDVVLDAQRIHLPNDRIRH